MVDTAPTWAGVKVSVKRTGDKLPMWRDEEDNEVIQRLEGTGLAVRQRMGGTGWQVLEYTALSLTASAVATLMPLRSIVPHDLIGFPIHGGVATFQNVYLSQVGHGEGPGFYPFEPDENVETPIRFLRLAPYSTGAPGILPFAGGASGALNAPTGVAAAATAPGQIAVTWVDTNSNESGYVMEFSDDAGATWQDGGACTAGCTGLTMGGLTAGTTYTFRVRAYNALVFSAWSSTASAVAT